MSIKCRPQRDSNPQPSDSKSDALSVSLCGLAGSLIFAVFVLLNMYNVLDMHNKYTVRIFIVSLYKRTKIIDYKIAHQPPPHLLLELMSPQIVRQLLCRHIKLLFVHILHLRPSLPHISLPDPPRSLPAKMTQTGNNQSLAVFFWAEGGGGKLGLDPGRPLKNRSKTAQILLEKPFKNDRKK